jgi:hypothetical protein
MIWLYGITRRREEDVEGRREEGARMVRASFLLVLSPRLSQHQRGRGSMKSMMKYR